MGKRLNRLTPLLVVIALVAAACGGDSDDGGDDAGPSALEAVYVQLEGLSGEERRNKLLELAAGEDSDITLYTSLSLDDSGPVTELFDDDYGIGVNLYRASASTVAQRAIQEADAEFDGADVILINGPEMSLLDSSGLLGPLKTPMTDAIVQEAVFPNWSAAYLNVFAAAWNTDTVDAAGAPASWEDVLGNYPGVLAMELGDYDWFATLVLDYFMADQGLSEDEAVDLFRTAAEGSLVVDGHTLMAELLAAGGFDVVTSAYQHRITKLQRDEAPVEWEPAIEPLIVRPNGIGIHADTRYPASALLFVEFMLDDVQPLLAEFGRTPANQSVPGGVPAHYQVLSVDLVALDADREKWETLYEEVVSRSGQTTIDE